MALVFWDSVLKGMEEWEIHGALSATGKKEPCLLLKWTLWKDEANPHFVARVPEIRTRENYFNLMSKLVAPQWMVEKQIVSAASKQIRHLAALKYPGFHD